MGDKFNFQEKLPEFVKEAWAGAMDAIYKTEDEVRTFVDKMVKRGKMTEDEGRKYLSEIRSKLTDSRKKIEKRANDGFEKTMHRINLPTKDEVETLNKRIASLTKKVNKLKKELAA